VDGVVCYLLGFEFVYWGLVMKTKAEIEQLIKRADQLTLDEQQELQDHVRALYLANEMLRENLVSQASGGASSAKQAAYGKR